MLRIQRQNFYNKRESSSCKHSQRSLTFHSNINNTKSINLHTLVNQSENKFSIHNHQKLFSKIKTSLCSSTIPTTNGNDNLGFPPKAMFTTTRSIFKKKSKTMSQPQPEHLTWKLDDTRQHSAVVIYPFNQKQKTKNKSYNEMRYNEAVSLAHTLGWDVVHSECIGLRRVDSAILFGRGQLDAIKQTVKKNNATLLYIDSIHVSSTQQRNIEDYLQKETNDDHSREEEEEEEIETRKQKNLKKKNRKSNSLKTKVQVIDRFTVILQIFFQRARSREAQLQVELARKTYEKGRVTHMFGNVGAGQHTRGGYGFMAGPGETPLDIKRREVEASITSLKKQLAQVEKTRHLHRDSRQKTAIPVVAVVGYTNAGKSAVVNRLTGAALESSDLLFCSVDTFLRSIHLGKSGLRALISDTVGFVSDLPHQLVKAFKSTLEEVTTADLIVHVRDISNPQHKEQNHQVHKVLDSLKVSDQLRNNMVEIWNKIDLLDQDHLQEIEEEAKNNSNLTLLTSALHGTHIESLRSVLEDRILESSGNYKYKIIMDALSSNQMLPWFHRNTRILEQNFVSDNELELITLMNCEVYDELMFTHVSKLKSVAQIK